MARISTQELLGRGRLGADDPQTANNVNEEQIKMRLEVIFQQYPDLKKIFEYSRTMHFRPEEWTQFATDVRDVAQDPEMAEAISRDPDLVAKYKFLFATAITENRNILNTRKQELVNIIFS